MIQEFSVHPKPQNNNAKIAFLITFLASAVSFVTYFLMDRYRGFVGLLAVMLLVTALLIYTKYISVEFYYDIAVDDESLPMFIVRQTIGKRQTTLCRLDLADILKVEATAYPSGITATESEWAVLVPILHSGITASM